jgi:hypothetical protein
LVNKKCDAKTDRNCYNDDRYDAAMVNDVEANVIVAMTNIYIVNNDVNINIIIK